MQGPDRQFWQQRFESGQIGWDRGMANPQLLAWLDSGALQPCRIVVPGCGSGWEVVELARRGFQVVGLDYTDAALERARRHVAESGVRAELVQSDVLAYEPDAPFEAIYEQTCLCALHPDRWLAYAESLHRWLAPGAVLWALFMQAPRPAALETGRIEGPPYHCDITAMRALFAAPRWDWPKPPFAKIAHPAGVHELAVPLVRARA